MLGNSLSTSSFFEFWPVPFVLLLFTAELLSFNVNACELGLMLFPHDLIADDDSAEENLINACACVRASFVCVEYCVVSFGVEACQFVLMLCLHEKMTTADCLCGMEGGCCVYNETILCSWGFVYCSSSCVPCLWGWGELFADAFGADASECLSDVSKDSNTANDDARGRKTAGEPLWPYESRHWSCPSCEDTLKTK